LLKNNEVNDGTKPQVHCLIGVVIKSIVPT